MTGIMGKPKSKESGSHNYQRQIIEGISENDLKESIQSPLRKRKKKKRKKENLNDDINFSHNVGLEEVKRRLKKINKLRGKDSNDFKKIPELRKRKPQTTRNSKRIISLNKLSDSDFRKTAGF